MIAWLDCSHSTGDAACDLLQQIDGQPEDGAFVTVVGRMADTVFIFKPEDQGCLRVDDQLLATSFDDEDAPSREHDLRQCHELDLSIAGTRRSTNNVVDA